MAMISKKMRLAIGGALRRMRWALPATALTVGTILPLSAAAEEATEEVEVFDVSTAEVEGEVNEDSLRYLLLEDFFVTAERIPSQRLSTPANVIVITSYEIDANHYQTIDEALSHVNGMVMNYINGSDRVLTLVDGRRTFINPPMKAIDRIEIVKGGGSALYGSDAVGGVINIITKKGDHDETTVDINTGSRHRHAYEITNQGNDGKLGWFIAAGIGKSRPYNYSGHHYANRSDARNMGGADQDINAAAREEKKSDYDDNDLMLRLDHRFDDRNSITFDIIHRSHENGQYDIYWYDKPEYSLGNQVSLTYNFKEGTSTPAFLRYFNNYSDAESYFYGKGNSRLQGVDYQNGWEFGQHKLIVGAEWHQSSAEHERWQNKKRKVTNQAYYLQDTISMGKKWTVVPGARFDHNSQFGSQWSPKIAANYNPDDSTKIYASWGRVYQAPSAVQLYSRWAHMLRYEDVPYLYEYYHGDPNLKPETGHTETIGIEHDFSDKVNVSLNLFQAKVSNYLDLIDETNTYDNTDWPGFFYFADLGYVNSSKDKQRGADLVCRQKIDDHWSYNIGYAYTHRERPLGSEEYMTHWRAPKHSYKAAVRYQNGPWRASLMGVMGSGSGGGLYMEDQFALLDFNIGYDVTDWATIYAKAINFTNQNHSYYGKRFNAPGRLFQFGLDCRF